MMLGSVPCEPTLQRLVYWGNGNQNGRGSDYFLVVGPKAWKRHIQGAMRNWGDYFSIFSMITSLSLSSPLTPFTSSPEERIFSFLQWDMVFIISENLSQPYYTFQTALPLHMARGGICIGSTWHAKQSSTFHLCPSIQEFASYLGHSCKFQGIHFDLLVLGLGLLPYPGNISTISEGSHYAFWVLI